MFEYRPMKGNFRAPLDKFEKIKWKPHRHIEYEKSDETWGLFFGFAYYSGEYDIDFLMDPNGFEIGEFVKGVSGTAVATNVSMSYPMCPVMFIDVEYFLVRNYYDIYYR